MLKFSKVRYLFTFAGFLGFFTIYTIRVNINVAIVAMVNSTVYVHSNTTSGDECKVPTDDLPINSSNHDQIKDGEFYWSPSLQATILGSFYYGYCVSQIPGGRLAEMYSGKWVFGIGTFITALLTLLTPMAARYSVDVLIAIRVLEGLAQGVTMPAMHSMLGRWLPDSEKAFLSTIIYCGIHIGTVVTLFVSGLLCDSEFLEGWPSAFYVSGILGCVWFILWSLFVTDSPHTHPFITKTELQFITSDQKIKSNVKLPSIPWRKISTSLPFWALVIAQVGGDWCFYTVLNDLPTYFSTILHFPIKQNGFLSSYPHLIQPAVGILVGFTSDTLLRKKIVSTNFVRKFCTAVCGFGQTLAFIGVCFAGCDFTLNVVFFTCAIVIGGFYYSGYNLTHLDLSPEYAGTLMGVTNTLSNIPGFLAPFVVGALTEHQQTLHQWKIVFGIVIAVLIVSFLFYVIFSSAEKQDWIAEEEQKSILDFSQEPSAQNSSNERNEEKIRVQM
ncbi:sialin isoform X1 [Parasteatoda tepidariorum]|uniref:sialin isoform X1 n=2 Tax=Parasteatoda tepidariorum TaxID=114398 RepID=UPI001C7259C6|nr:sialin isoform X1 [Parasteatoda tepidariorum]